MVLAVFAHLYWEADTGRSCCMCWHLSYRLIFSALMKWKNIYSSIWWLLNRATCWMRLTKLNSTACTSTVWRWVELWRLHPDCRILQYIAIFLLPFHPLWHLSRIPCLKGSSSGLLQIRRRIFRMKVPFWLSVCKHTVSMLKNHLWSICSSWPECEWTWTGLLVWLWKIWEKQVCNAGVMVQKNASSLLF